VIWPGKRFTGAMEIAVQNRNLRHFRLLSNTSHNLNVSVAALRWSCPLEKKSDHSMAATSPPFRLRITTGVAANHIWYMVVTHIKAKHRPISAPPPITTKANG
jgi:hypothetical protein